MSEEYNRSARPPCDDRDDREKETGKRKSVRFLGDINEKRTQPTGALHPKEIQQRHIELSNREGKELSEVVSIATEILRTIRNDLYFVDDILTQFTELDQYRNVPPAKERVGAIILMICDSLEESER